MAPHQHQRPKSEGFRMFDRLAGPFRTLNTTVAAALFGGHLGGCAQDPRELQEFKDARDACGLAPGDWAGAAVPGPGVRRSTPVTNTCAEWIFQNVNADWHALGVDTTDFRSFRETTAGDQVLVASMVNLFSVDFGTVGSLVSSLDKETPLGRYMAEWKSKLGPEIPLGALWWHLLIREIDDIQPTTAYPDAQFLGAYHKRTIYLPDYDADEGAQAMGLDGSWTSGLATHLLVHELVHRTGESHVECHVGRACDKEFGGAHSIGLRSYEDFIATTFGHTEEVDHSGVYWESCSLILDSSSVPQCADLEFDVQIGARCFRN